MTLKNSLNGIKVIDASSVLAGPSVATYRSEERRVGKEWRSRWGPDH